MMSVTFIKILSGITFALAFMLIFVSAARFIRAFLRRRRVPPGNQESRLQNNQNRPVSESKFRHEGGSLKETQSHLDEWSEQEKARDRDYKEAVEFVRIGIKKDRIDKTNIDRYFDVLIRYVEKAEHTIHVLEFEPVLNVLKALSRSNEPYFQEIAKYLGGRYEDYFKTIEHMVVNKGVRYVRIIQLPLAVRDEARKKEQREVIEMGIDYAFKKTIEHLTRLWKAKVEDRFQLYIIPEAAVSYSYMLIDNSYAISEFFRINRSGVSFPDELYVNKWDSIPEQIMNRQEMINSILKNNKGVMIDDFIAASNALKERREKEAVYIDLERESANDKAEIVKDLEAV